MGRMLPSECRHGRIYDWGDFGDNDTAPEDCPACDEALAEYGRELAAEAARLVERHRGQSENMFKAAWSVTRSEMPEHFLARLDRLNADIADWLNGGDG